MICAFAQWPILAQSAIEKLVASKTISALDFGALSGGCVKTREYSLGFLVFRYRMQTQSQRTGYKQIFQKNPQKCQTFKKSINSFKNQRIGNDSISSARIFRPTIGYNPTQGACKPEPNQATVAVYQHPEYKGKCKILSLGTYNNSKEMNFKNDSISSIEFGNFSKVRIKVCQHSKFRGRCEYIRTSLSSLYNSKIGDNQITSIRVFDR